MNPRKDILQVEWPRPLLKAGHRASERHSSGSSENSGPIAVPRDSEILGAVM